MKRAMWLAWLALLILATACGSGQGPFARPTPTPSPSPTPPVEAVTDVAVQFMAAWAQDDMALMYASTTFEFQRTLSRGAFEQRYKRFAEDAGINAMQFGPPAIAMSSQQEALADFEIAFDSAFGGEFRAHTELDLRLEGGAWKIAWKPSAILQGLGEGSQVRFDPWTPQRGNIYAGDDSGLAVQATLITVGVVPAWIQDETAMLDALSRILGMPSADIRARYASAAKGTWFMPIADITPEQNARYQDVLAALPGVQRQEKTIRTYPDDFRYSHVVGYTGLITADELTEWGALGYKAGDIIGKTGVELWGEQYLAGGRGGRLVIVASDGSLTQVLAERQPELSQSVYLTLDPKLQAAAYDALGDKIGAVVALDPRNGDVLAMVSKPAVNANAMAQGLTGEQWQVLFDDPAYPLLDRTVQGQYPFGSVFKVVSISAALESGAFGPSSEFHCSGSWTGLNDGLTRNCWLTTGHGNILLMEALTQSCDVAFYEVGKALDQQDREILPKFARAFGLGAPTGIQGVSESPGLVPDAAWKDQHTDVVSNPFWTTQDAVNLVIGQGYLLVTPLQAANMMAAVANGGTLYKPRLVRQIMSLGGGSPITFETQELGRLPVSAEHLQAIEAALKRVCMSPQGTAYLTFQTSDVAVAGKTGTAETAQEEPHAWFVGYAPADDPQIVIAVIVEHGGEGGVVAAPIFRQIMESYFASSAP